VARGQYVFFSDVFDIVDDTLRSYQRKHARLRAFFEKGLPELRNLRLESGLRQVVQATADDLFARNAQQPAGPGTRISRIAAVICNQNRR